MWTFAIRKDSKWSDGSPCSARDFECSCKRQLDPATARPVRVASSTTSRTARRSTRSRCTDAEPGRRSGQGRLDARGDARRAARLLPVLSAYLAALPGAPRLDREVRRQVDGGRATSSATGPSCWRRGSTTRQIVLKKNQHFFGAKDITLEKVIIPIIPIASGALPYENNEIDLTRLQAADLKRFQGDPDDVEGGVPLSVSRHLVLCSLR